MRTRTRRVSLGGGGNYLGWKNMVDGDWFVGKFIAQGTDRNGNPTYKITLEEFETHAKINSTVANPDGTGDPEVGMTIILNGITAFNNMMENAQVGDDLEIRYNGKSALPKNHTYAGTAAHQVEVFVLGDDATEEVAIDDL